MKQHTINQAINIKGVGIHSGKTVSMRLVPAACNSGIVFVRTDFSPNVEIPALYSNVWSTAMSTDIGTHKAVVRTIEHLMSALHCVGVDNLRIELDSEEIPVMDGSAASFVFLIQETGLQEQAGSRKFMKITQSVTVTDQDRIATLSPAPSLIMDFAIDFDHSAIGSSRYTIDLSAKSFAKHIAPARTFGFLSDVEKLHAAGLGLGGSINNAIILDEYRVLNPEGLRFDDEFVRHKILDAVGDLYTSGYPVIGKYSASRAGHALNNKLLQAVVEQQAYTIVCASPESQSECEFFTTVAC